MAALIEPFFYCLLASLIWAPAVFLTASFIARDGNTLKKTSLSGKVWPAALVIAALPVLLAPVAAAFGLSLRAPAPLPPMADPSGPMIASFEPGPLAANDAPSTVSLADILRMTAVLYFYGFLMLLVLAAVRHVWFAYRLNYAYKLDEPRLEAELEIWRTRIGVNRRPRYVFSHIVSSVCVYGFFRPVIVMPMHLLDRVSIEDAALMGAHEMAHIKRGDVALFALCSVAKAVFWFNPFMHQICARANLTAEQGADALVLARGVNRRQYAHCFVQGLRIAADARNGFAGELIPSFTPFDKRSRRQRLDAILSGTVEPSALTLSTKIGLSAGAMIAAGLAFAQAAFAVAPPAIEDALTVRPVEGKVTSKYGAQDRVFGDSGRTHTGIDIKAPRGTPVRAAGRGKVTDATNAYRGEKSWGNIVVIDHGHGVVTRYAHLDSYLVNKGDYVKAGDVIGAVGSTGKSTGPHLHFEIISEGENIDPTPIAAPPQAPSQKTRATLKRNVQISPAPVAVAPIEPVAKASASASASASSSSSASASSAKSSRDRANETKLENKMHKLEERLRSQFDQFDAFADLEGMTIEFGDLELEGFRGAKEWTAVFENSSVEFKDLAKFAMITPDMAELEGAEYLTQEEIEEIRHEASADAAEAAADAMREMRDRIAEQRQAREEAIREKQEIARERAQEERERLAEQRQAREEAMREMQEAAREREREQREQGRELKQERKRHAAEMKRMRQDAERDIAEAEQDWAYEYGHMMSESEILEQREQALRNAKQNLELQLAEIERRRKELNKSE